MGETKITRRTELLPGTLDMLILNTLSNGPMHGYGIAQFIQMRSKDVLQVGEGSLYPALQRMKLQGWITAEWGTSDNNRRARFYRLTPKGRKRLHREVAEFDHFLAAIAGVMKPA